MSLRNRPDEAGGSSFLSFLSILLLLLAPLVSASRLDAESSVDELCSTLHDRELRTSPSDQREREVAIHKLARRDSLEATKCLTRVLADPFKHIQQEAVFWMQDRLTSKNAIQWLAKHGIQSRKPQQVRNVLRVLGRLKDTGVITHLESLATARNDEVLIELARTVRRLRPSSPPPFLYDLAEHHSKRVRAAAFRALGSAGGEGSFIRKHLDSINNRVLAEAVLALGKIGGETELERLDPFRSHRHWRVRLMALRGLRAAERNVDGENASMDRTFTAARDALSDDSWHVKAGAIDVLVGLWQKRVIPTLIEGFKQAEGRLKLDYLNALQSLTGETLGPQPINWAGWWQQNASDFELGDQPDNWRAGESADPSEGDTVAFFGIPLYSNRLMFVMDFSGGMKGTVEDGKFKGKTKIGLAKRELLNTIKRLRANQRFNILIYRYPSTFPPKPGVQSPYKKGRRLFPASRKARAAAYRWVRSLEAKGWGAFSEAFRAATVNPAVDTIVFLSDGKPTRGKFAGTTAIVEKRFFEALDEMNRYRQVMIHTVLTGVGAGGTDEDYMKRIANETGGIFKKK